MSAILALDLGTTTGWAMRRGGLILSGVAEFKPGRFEGGGMRYLRFTRWLDKLLADQGPDILRAKGILDVAGEDRRLVFQAVHMILEGDFQGQWKDGDKRYSRLVFIGRNLDEAKLREGFEACAA